MLVYSLNMKGSLEFTYMYHIYLCTLFYYYPSLKEGDGDHKIIVIISTTKKDFQSNSTQKIHL